MNKEKVVIVGASHGGHQSIIELLDTYKNLDITLYEAGDFVSFMSCGMELYLENKVTDVNDVRNFRPEEFEEQGVTISNNHLVKSINLDEKTIDVESDGHTETVSYDKLILSSGVTPNELPIPGKELENVFLMRGYDWATKIKSKLEDSQVKNIVVIGSGYIGIEAVEASIKAGKNVTVIDTIDRPLGTYLNSEMTDILSKELTDKGVNVVLGSKVEEFLGDQKVSSVKTDKGTFDADVVIQATGIKPNTEWLKGTIDLDDHGFIKTNEYLQTNDQDVYAVGDATLAYSIPAQKNIPIALATVARREARYVAKHIFEDKHSEAFTGVVGSSALSLFDYHFATSGLNQMSATRSGINAKSSFFKDSLRPSYIPESDNPEVFVQLTYDEKSHVILGGAVMSKYDITAQGNTIALAVQQKMTLEQLAEADFFFQPGFDRQWSLLNLAAQSALNQYKF
ncbi:FAD-dependent oxidoreductase [Companilactobacillus metriopterae]|uniref:FAD-dependent oxidoreductase n=1 Tax=Companilactobacillus metriopterae TaxID=1909267 RepID=UPI00100B230A|nr:FAD-dependent oxidoreductase [Companilactobacillus metriopterae]